MTIIMIMYFKPAHCIYKNINQYDGEIARQNLGVFNVVFSNVLGVCNVWGLLGS